MDRLSSYLSAFTPLVLAPFLSQCGDAPAEEVQRPNILFIVSEDNGPEMGCYGAPVNTPILDSLAAAGVRYVNAYVPQAGSSPSRACFLTGLYPHQNGQVGLATWKYAMYNEETPNVVNSLKAAGYRTGMVGKLHVNPESAFDLDYHKINSGNFKREGMERYALFSEEFITSGEGPFYLQVNLPETHEPFIPQVDSIPAVPLTADDVEVLPYIGLDSPMLREHTANYYNCMMRLDHYVGELLDVLERTGVADNTLVVYIGDHGADLIRGKRTCYEGGLRVPMTIYWPGHTEAGVVYEHAVSTLDLYPTFLAAAGLNVPDYLPGEELQPSFHGSNKPLHKYTYCEYNTHSNHNPYPQRTINDGRYKLIWSPLHGTVNSDYAYTLGIKDVTEEVPAALEEAPEYIRKTYAEMECPPEYQLFDLEADPYEFHNLADDPAYTKVLKKLSKALVKWQEETSDPFIDPEVARRFYQSVMDTGLKKVALPYKEYMDPHLSFE